VCLVLQARALLHADCRASTFEQARATHEQPRDGKMGGGKKKKGALGSGLIKQRFRGRDPRAKKDGILHTTTLNDGYELRLDEDGFVAGWRGSPHPAQWARGLRKACGRNVLQV